MGRPSDLWRDGGRPSELWLTEQSHLERATLAVTSIASIASMNLGDISLDVLDGNTLAVTSTASITGKLRVNNEVSAHTLSLTSVASIGGTLNLNVISGSTVSFATNLSGTKEVEISANGDIIINIDSTERPPGQAPWRNHGLFFQPKTLNQDGDYSGIGWCPEGNAAPDIWLTGHKKDADGVQHEHISWYTSNATGTLIKHWQMDYLKDYPYVRYLNLEELEIQTDRIILYNIAGRDDAVEMRFEDKSQTEPAGHYSIETDTDNFQLRRSTASGWGTTKTFFQYAGGNGNFGIGGPLVPLSTATYDMGSSSLKWKDVYLSNNAYVAGLTDTKYLTVTSNASIGNNLTVGAEIRGTTLALTSVASIDTLRIRQLDTVIYASQYATPQLAINALPSTGGRVVLPAGVISTASGIAVKVPYTSIVGSSAGGTLIDYSGTGSAIFKDSSTATGGADYLSLEDIKIKGHNTTTDVGIDLTGISRTFGKNVNIYQSGIGIKFNGLSYYNNIINPIIVGALHGLEFDGGANENKVYGGEIGSILAGGNGIYMDSGNNNLCLAVDVESSNATLAYIGPDSYQNHLQNCRFEGDGSTGVVIANATGGSHNVLFNNYYGNSMATCIVDQGTSTWIFETTGTTSTFGAVNQFNKDLWLKKDNPSFYLSDTTDSNLAGFINNNGLYIQSSAAAQTARDFIFQTAGAEQARITSVGEFRGKTLAISSTASISSTLDITGLTSTHAGLTNTGEIKSDTLALTSVASLTGPITFVNEITGKTLSLTSTVSISGNITLTNPLTSTGLYINQTGILAASNFALDVYSNIDQDNNSVYLVRILQDNAGSSRGALTVANDGTGVGIYVNQVGNGYPIYIGNTGTNYDFSCKDTFTVKNGSMVLASNASIGGTVNITQGLQLYNTSQPSVNAIGNSGAFLWFDVANNNLVVRAKNAAVSVYSGTVALTIE